ncbi:MAG: DEAD/DEAH box helicase [Polyangiaceae bacterium]
MSRGKPKPAKKPLLAESLEAFSAPTARWFSSNFEAPTEAQARSWSAIRDGASTLLFAPTGSGKTLAAFLSASDRLLFEVAPPKEARCRVLYVSPLKSLAVDVERNLRAPLGGITEAAREAGVSFHDVRIAVRSGDTPAKDRVLQGKAPPDILLTTPESLALMLTSSARDMLASVDTVIIDEIHALAATKRGAHFFLALERLEELRQGKSFQRIGLSATQRPLDEVARLLGGFTAEGTPRPVTIVDVSRKRNFDLRVEMPRPLPMQATLMEQTALQRKGRRGRFVSTERNESDRQPRANSQWSAIVPRLVELVKSHRTTMVFVNSRRLAERMAREINEAAGESLALAHHGSLAREERSRAEEDLKSGVLPCIVATASMELGLDIGAVELVVQIEAPPSVASGLQRIGRSNHEVGGVPKGILMPKHRGDLVASAAALLRMRELAVERTRYLRNPLDVLAQHIVGMVAMEDWNPTALYEVVRRCACFHELPRESFDGVLDMLSGRYPSTEFAELRPRIHWDRVKSELRARKGSRLLSVTNVGTIPERGLYTVVLDGEETDSKKSRRVGELDEEMVFELREGEIILLGASSWRVQRITHERVVVTPAPGEPGKMPFWRGDGLGRSAEFGEAIGRTLREVGANGLGALAADLDSDSAESLVAYIEEQKEATGVLPTDRTIVVERLRDELGDYRVCILSPYGKQVHIPLAMCIRAKARARFDIDVEPVALDDGIALRVPDLGEAPDVLEFLPSPEELEDLLFRTLGDSSLFAARFREAAGRALLLPKRRPGKRTPLWAQRKRASDLLQVASRYPSFPIILETYRECMKDVFDVAALSTLLTRIRSREVRLKVVDTESPSPFAASILFSYLATFVYDGDLPLAERRAQALTVDAKQLRELLGEAALRELLDVELLAQTERHLQRFDRSVSSAEGVQDLLRIVGDLDEDELLARAPDASPHLTMALSEKTVLPIFIQRRKRFVVAEDAGLYEQALGCALPQGVPTVYREPRERPLRELVVRYAKTHGPFTAAALAGRYGLSAGSLDEVLSSLVDSQVLARGEFLPGGSGEEFCDAEVLRLVKRKTLATLRNRVEPVSHPTFARFLLSWQGVAYDEREGATLYGALDRLQGYPLTLTDLEEAVLPARIPGYRAGDLDQALISGAFRWVGVGGSDEIALYATESLLLCPPPIDVTEGEIAARLREHLVLRGASFFAELAGRERDFKGEVLSTLWEMVAHGEVTNDTLAPLRSKLRGRKRESPRRGMGQNFRAAPVGIEGRWSLVPHHPAFGTRHAPGEAESRLHATKLLLDRYGVLTREAVTAEEWPGGFSSLYSILKQLEERSEVRRGMFIDGLGATQFALPGTDERLRTPAPSTTPPSGAAGPLVLAARDPANPYGAILPWPAPSGPSSLPPQRAQRTRVILDEGELLGWLNRNGSLTTFEKVNGERHATRMAEALIARAKRQRPVLLPLIDGEPASKYRYVAAFRKAGFVVVRAGLAYVVPREARKPPE